MARGRKVADVYVEATLDKDGIKRGVRDIPRDVGPDADRAGRDLGDKVGRGLAASVESWSAKIAKARRQEQVAAQNVTLAETRLNEARGKGIGEGSRLLALEQQLERAKWKLTDANTAATTATSKHTEAQRKLAESLTMVGKGLGPAAQKAGDDAGGKLALGMRMSIVRNSPLIVAAVAGGLTAGAPLVMAGATGLFAGIGIAAAAQSDEVRQMWLGTWQDVRDGTITAAKPIEATLVGLADRVGDAFDRNRPRLRDMFTDAAPQIDAFGDGLIGLAENALPGFERAIQRGMPVTQGFADFLEKTGTGLTGMLDRISQRAPEAGRAFSMWGDTFGTLLPMLGELLGQGAELATLVLPALNGTLGISLSVLTALGPALPVVVTGLLGLKAAKTATGWISGLSEKIVALDTGSGKVRGALDKVSAAMTPVNVVGGALAVTVGLLAAATQDSDAQTRRWAEGLNQGGDAAKRARSEMNQHRAAVQQATTGFTGFALSMTAAGAATGIYADDVAKAEAAHRKWWSSMDPLAQAQAKVAEWTKTLSDRLGDENASTADVEAAKRRLAHWADEEAAAQDRVQMATKGVTEAMLAQADQALASIDAGFAHRQSQLATRDAMEQLRTTMADSEATADDVARATLDVEQSLMREAAAAAEAKVSISDLEQGTAEYDRRIQNETLAALYAMREGLDPQMRAAVDSMIGSLERGGASLDEIGRKNPSPLLTLQTAAFNAAYSGSMNILGVLGNQRPTPVAQLNANPFSQVANWMGGYVNTIHAWRASPIATLYGNTQPAQAALNAFLAMRAVKTVVMQLIPGGASGGNVGELTRGFAGGGTPSRRSDGRLVGPGGPLDDLISAVTNTGEQIRVANSEWIINGMVSRRQGDARMAALNAGMADIVVRKPMRGAASGGSVASSSSQPASDIRERGGHTIHLSVTFAGAGMGTDRRSMRQAAEMLRDEVRKLDRELAR